MDRLLQNTAGAIGVTFYVTDTATNPTPDSATVKIDRADGTSLVATTAAIEDGTGKFKSNLLPAQTALLDRLTATWTATINGQVQVVTTRHEIVGGFLISLAELRTDPTLADQTAYSDERLASFRTMAERALEKACGVAFVPRYEYETVLDRGGDWLPVQWHRVRSVRSLSQNGTDLSITGLSVAGGAVQWAGGMASGFQLDVAVGYEHGHDFPPAETPRVISRLVRHYGIDSPLDDRALRLDADNGSWVMSTPGMRGQHFGIPEVDAFVQEHGYKPSGFAAVSICP